METAESKKTSELEGVYRKHGECRFCHQIRMMTYMTDVSQEQVDEDATRACTCQEARDYAGLRVSAEKAKEQLHTMNEQVKTRFPESVEELGNNAIDIIAAAGAESVTIKSDSRKITLKMTSKGKIKVLFEKKATAEAEC